MGSTAKNKSTSLEVLLFLERCLSLQASYVDFVSDVHCVSDVTSDGVVVNIALVLFLMYQNKDIAFVKIVSQSYYKENRIMCKNKWTPQMIDILNQIFDGFCRTEYLHGYIHRKNGFCDHHFNLIDYKMIKSCNNETIDNTNFAIKISEDLVGSTLYFVPRILFSLNDDFHICVELNVNNSEPYLAFCNAYSKEKKGFELFDYYESFDELVSELKNLIYRYKII